jgi:hypothetical protein
MYLTDTFEPVVGRLPLRAEILIAEGLARKATHYNLTITGPRFITRASDAAHAQHRPATGRACTCCARQCIVRSFDSYARLQCVDCVLCDAYCPYPRDGDATWESSRALHRREDVIFAASAETDDTTVKTLLDSIHTWLTQQATLFLGGQEVRRADLELILIGESGILIPVPDNVTLGMMEMRTTFSRVLISTVTGGSSSLRTTHMQAAHVAYLASRTPSSLDNLRIGRDLINEEGSDDSDMRLGEIMNGWKWRKLKRVLERYAEGPS